MLKLAGVNVGNGQIEGTHSLKIRLVLSHWHIDLGEDKLKFWNVFYFLFYHTLWYTGMQNV